jgi:hypothetical protein
MKRSGVDELYVLARCVLLDALEALGKHARGAAGALGICKNASFYLVNKRHLVLS